MKCGIVLQIIINKFPEELVNDWCEVFFLPLVQRMTVDPSSKCREAIGTCLKALMQRVTPEPLDKLANYCLLWLGGGDSRLARTAAQVSHQSHTSFINCFFGLEDAHDMLWFMPGVELYVVT